MREWTARLLILALCASVPLALWMILTDVRGQHLLYPEWSTMRSDEKGTSVWYESLQRDPHFSVSRNFRPLPEWREHGMTLLLTGMRLASFASGVESLLSMCEHIAETGNRVVVGLDPEGTPQFLRRPEPLADFKKHGMNPVWQKDKLLLVPDASWRTIRQRESGTETIERAVGKGTIVLVASSRAISNAGIARNRDTPFLLALTGPGGSVVFDESHLGSVETGTIMGLARHYHLQGLLGGLLVLFLLFAWRNWLAFPPRTELAPAPTASIDPLDGLAGLLARALPQNKLIDECVHARTQTGRNPEFRSAMERAAQTGATRDPAAVFRSIQSAINRKQISDKQL